jgi:hypothetical protein
LRVFTNKLRFWSKYRFRLMLTTVKIINYIFSVNNFFIKASKSYKNQKVLWILTHNLRPIIKVDIFGTNTTVSAGVRSLTKSQPRVVKVSISPTFYTQLFVCVKVFCAAFLYLQIVRLCNFWQKNFSAKAVGKIDYERTVGWCCNTK